MKGCLVLLPEPPGLGTIMINLGIKLGLQNDASE